MRYDEMKGGMRRTYSFRIRILEPSTEGREAAEPTTDQYLNIAVLPNGFDYCLLLKCT